MSSIPIRIVEAPPGKPAGWDVEDLARELGHLGTGFNPVVRDAGDDTLNDTIADFVDAYARPLNPTSSTATASTARECRTIGEVLPELSAPKQPEPLAKWMPVDVMAC